MSRRQVSTVEALNARTHAELRFRDFASLRSGRDRYSAVRLDRLAEMVDPDHYEIVERELAGDVELIARCLRWCCRGLEVTRAVRKVKCDLEVTRNARGAALAAPSDPSHPWRQ